MSEEQSTSGGSSSSFRPSDSRYVARFADMIARDAVEQVTWGLTVCDRHPSPDGMARGK